jgi:hypothetical protein
MNHAIAIIGSLGGGTSCTAGVFHALGIDMGRDFADLPHGTSKHPCTFEDAALRDLMPTLIPSPIVHDEYPKPLTGPETIAACLIQYLATRERPCGMKHTGLALCLPILRELGVKLVDVRRPKADVVATLSRRPAWQRGGKDPGAYVDTINEHKAKATFDFIVDYPALMASPATEVNRIANWLGKPATREAIEHVKGTN